MKSIPVQATTLSLGDNGSIDVTGAKTIDSTDAAENSGATDTITDADGTNVILGGTARDVINVNGTGDDIVVGDHGTVVYNNGVDLSTVTATETHDGGNDEINVAAGNNIVVGGADQDAITTGAGDDIILGDNGSVDVTGSKTIDSTDTAAASGDVDTIIDSAGDNVILGGTAGDFITTGADNDIILGDHGTVTYDDGVNLSEVESTEVSDGGIDTINVDDGNNIVVGGQARDSHQYGCC